MQQSSGMHLGAQLGMLRTEALQPLLNLLAGAGVITR